MSSDSGQTTAVRTIGRYRAFDELGRGAMGVVYRGFDPVIGRTVALKTLLLDGADAHAKEFRDRHYREAAAAGALSHPNIVTIFDIVEDGATTAVAMEFIEGRSLASIIGDRAPMPIDLAADIFDQIAAALDYAGSHGIVHRDIKPANILITPAGRVKITDFGVARLALSTMTQAGTVLGSPSYMSPEQVRGLPLDGRSDLFSAAVVFYEMITRERPFAGNDVATTMYRIAHEPPTPPGHFNVAIGPAVTAVLDRALAKNPADRYQNGEDLAAELRLAANLGAGDHARPAASAGLSTLGTPPPLPVPQIVVPDPPGGGGTHPAAVAAARSAAAEGPSSALAAPPGSSIPTVVTPAPAGPLSAMPLPSMPLPQVAPAPSGPPLAPFPRSGAAPERTADAGPALPALPPGAVATPQARRSRSGAGATRRTLVVAGAAATLLVAAVVVAVVLMRGGGSPALPEGMEPEPPPAAAETTRMPEPAVPPSTPAAASPSAVTTQAPLSAPPPARPVSPRAATPSASSGQKAGTTTPAAAAPAAPAAPPDLREDPARPAAVTGGRIYTVTDVDQKPQVLHQVPPAYPPDALQRRIEDIIVVNALVGSDGRVEDVKIIRHSAKSPTFDAAATAAVRQYEFSPARKGGQAVRCWFSVGIPFQLPRQ